MCLLALGDWMKCVFLFLRNQQSQMVLELCPYRSGLIYICAGRHFQFISSYTDSLLMLFCFALGSALSHMTLGRYKASR